MNWIDKLERKFGRHGGITNLTVYIIICYVIGYLLTYMNPSLLSMMSLDVSKILQGQFIDPIHKITSSPFSVNKYCSER